MNIESVTDEYPYTLKHPSTLCVQVISGSPAMVFSQDGFTTQTTLDLTASSTYPNAKVELPACQYKFTLSGGEAKVSTLK